MSSPDNNHRASTPTPEPAQVEIVAEEMARILLRLDVGDISADHDPFPNRATEGLTWSYIDQGEVDFELVANEVIPLVLANVPAQGWVIINADETQFRFMEQGFFQWTDDLTKAMFFATRASADQAAAEDPDDVRIVTRPIPKEA